MPRAPFRPLLASTTLQRLAICVALVAAVVLQARPGAARPDFPKEMREVMQLDCNPTCLLCHTVETGGKDSLNTYGDWTKGQGIHLGGGPSAVYGEEGDAATDDFDMDGTPDRTEIMLNTDPRTEDEVGVCSDAVYGCGAAQVAPGGTPRSSAWALVAALGLAAFLWRQVRA